MPTVEVFFDYACPYCLRGHEILMELLPQHPKIVIEWHPCEAHPRPDRYGLHSDLCTRGMFYAAENGVDLIEYHRMMYRAALMDSVNIEDLNALAQVVDGLMDSKRFYEALSGGSYVDRLLRNNQLAWGTYQFSAVPSYRMNGKLLKSMENIGITKLRLAAFLEANG